MGVNRNRMQFLFSEGLPRQPEKPTPIDSWMSAPLADGTPRTLGKSQDDALLMELVGPENDLTQVTLVSAFFSDSVTSFLYNRFLLGLLVPEWEDGMDWLTESILEADQFMQDPDNDSKNFTVSVTHYGRTIELTVSPTVLLVSLSIKRVKP